MLGIKQISLTFLPLFLSLLSCKNTVSSPTYNDQDLIGKWVVQTIISKGTMSSGNLTIRIDTTIQPADSNNFFLFYQDKTYFYKWDESFLGKKAVNNTNLPKTMDQFTDSGTWSLNGSDLTLNSSIDSSTIIVEIDINNSTLKLVMSFDIKEDDTAMDIKETFLAIKQ